MRLIFIILLLLTCPCSLGGYDDGTLLVSEHSNDFVEKQTHSPYTHVAIIINNYVYEAAPITGVTKYTLNDYLKITQNQKKDYPRLCIHVLKPKHSFTPDQIKKMKDYAESQLGRKYSFIGFLIGIDYLGTQCAELVGYDLQQGGIKMPLSPSRMFPSDLANLPEYQETEVLLK